MATTLASGGANRPMQAPEDPRLEVARHRYRIIAPLVVRALDPGDQAHLLTDLSHRLWDTVDGGKERYHRRTLTRWLSRYRQHGFEGLMPEPRHDRGTSTRLPDAVLERAAQLRREDPRRSVHTIIRILELERLVLEGEIKRSTLSHALCRKGLNRAQLLRDRQIQDGATFRRRESPYPNAMWQVDTQLALHLPDNGGRRRNIYLVATIDDYSRHVVARYYLADNRPSLGDLLKRAILMRGKPEILYSDNGQNYRSHMLEDACAHLGIDLRHARPYRPQGKGKIERFFQSADRFNHEAQALIDNGTVQTLDTLQTLFASWLKSEYNLRVHSATHERPEDRLAHTDPLHPVQLVDPAQLTHAFLWLETRKVTSAATISVEGNDFEVNAVLARKTIDIRYDPYDLKTILVAYKGQSFGTASLLNLHRQQSRHVPSRPEDATDPDAVDAGQAGTAATPRTPFLNMLQQETEKAHRAALGSMRFQITQAPDPAGSRQESAAPTGEGEPS